MYRDGWVYPEEKYKQVLHVPEVALAAADHQREYFFPECSDFDTLAYDCLAKTMNQALGCLFFSQRE